MPFEAATLAHLEDALAEAFHYHNQLDGFVVRTGIPSRFLRVARENAEAQVATTRTDYDRAPKRFVAHHLLNQLQALGQAGDGLLARLFTEFVNGSFPDASARANAAIAALKAQAEFDRKRTSDEREQKDKERRAAEEEKWREEDAVRGRREEARAKLLRDFDTLTNKGNAQQRGYLLEGFLNGVFELEGLEPRKSFRIVGEQIDGSFVWSGNVFLLEAKWQTAGVAGAEFGAFHFKIEGKSADTRGLYVSINGYTPGALQALKDKGATRFICIDGAHLVRCLQPGQTLRSLLSVIWRHAAETGEAYLPVNQMG